MERVRNRDHDNPFGRGGLALHDWITKTRTFRQMFGDGQGTTGVDDDFVAVRSAATGPMTPVRAGGATIRQYLREGLVDEMHVAIAPVVLGTGEHLLGGIDTLALGYTCAKHVTTPDATHFVLTRQPR